MAKGQVRISTHRIGNDYLPVFEGAINILCGLPAGDRKMELTGHYLTIGSIIPWKNDEGYQGVLRKVKTKGMDPNTDYETGESREGDHKPSEGQGAGAAFIYDRARKLLIFYHGIPHSTHTMLIKYLHNKTGVDASEVKLSGVPKQGALENFKQAKDIRTVKINLDGPEAKVMAENLAKKSFFWNTVNGMGDLKVWAEVKMHFDIKKDPQAKDQIESALTSEIDDGLGDEFEMRVTYRDAGGTLHENVDLSSELFVEKFVSPDANAYMLDETLVTLLNANYDMLINEHPVLNQIP